MLGNEPREPYKKGQLIVWFVKDKEITEDQIKEICDNCGVTLDQFHPPERCTVNFDEKDVDVVTEKLYAWSEYIRSVTRNHYLYLCK
jgi:hypothetical protein